MTWSEPLPSEVTFCTFGADATATYQQELAKWL
jgi:hypothetical protein